jgi:hypothetical protein
VLSPIVYLYTNAKYLAQFFPINVACPVADVFSVCIHRTSYESLSRIIIWVELLITKLIRTLNGATYKTCVLHSTKSHLKFCSFGAKTQVLAQHENDLENQNSGKFQLNVKILKL